MRHDQSFACLFTLAVAASLTFLNLDGYQEHLMLNIKGANFRGPGDFVGEPPMINWVHGWPVGCAVRMSIKNQVPGPIGNPWIHTSRWPFDSTPIKYFSPLGAVVDLLICVLISGGTYFGAKRVAARFGLSVRFHLASILAFVAIAAVVVWQRDWIFATRYTGQAIAFAGVAMGLIFCVTWLISICTPAGTASTIPAP